MFRHFALGVVRRVVASPSAARPFLLRSISTTPVVCFPAKADASTRKTGTRTVTQSKPKPKAVAARKEKKEKKKEVTWTKDQLKVPTRPGTTPFVVFCNEERSKASKPDTLAASQGIIKEAAQKWHSLTPEEKHVYYDKAAERNVVVAREYNEWLKNLDSRVLRAINVKRKAAGKPRIRRHTDSRPRPPFFIFLAKYRADHPTLSILDAAKEAGAAWRALSEQDTQQYKVTARAEREAYVSRSPV